MPSKSTPKRDPTRVPKRSPSKSRFSKTECVSHGFRALLFCDSGFCRGSEKGSEIDAQMVSKSSPKRVPKGVSKRALQNPEVQKKYVSLRFRGLYFVHWDFVRAPKIANLDTFFGLILDTLLGSILGAF